MIDKSEKASAILQWQVYDRHKKAKREGDTTREQNFKTQYPVQYMDKNVLGAHMLEVSLSGVGTVLRPERDAWSMVK